MGTMVEYTIAAESAADSRRAIEAAHREIERVSTLLWEEDSASTIYRFNRARDTVRASAEVASFLDRSREYHTDTRGAFDVTIRPVMDLYQFGNEDAQPPRSDDLSSAIQSVDMTAFSVDTSGILRKSRPEISLAVGGVAKGYAVDRAVAILKGAGIRSAVVNAGGDLYCLGTNEGKPWRVGVRDPDDASSVIHVLHVTDAAVATSGDYQQYFDYEGVRYHHILNPETGRPARMVRSATVIAP
ncbi:MAG: FAD:protein FMN transferase, partial [Rhodothermia bacterium]|nr:FAD:protein FMN transferase [Rhodothermia bacterium]